MTRRPPGLYEELITRQLQAALDEARTTGWRDEIEGLDKAEAPRVLARFVRDLVEPLLGSFGGEDRLDRQVDFVNALVEFLRTGIPGSPVFAEDAIAPPARQLLSLVKVAEAGLAGPSSQPERPSVPLAASHLLINSPRDHTVSFEIQKEIASADRVDLLISFLKWSGWRLVRDRIREFLERRPGGLRVLTTTYMGATDRKVLDELVRLGAQVKVSFDTRRTRLHAKAWLFHRNSGFSTAFVGSSNLSAAALVDGLEWNVRLSQVETPARAASVPGRLRAVLGRGRVRGLRPRARPRAGRPGPGPEGEPPAPTPLRSTSTSDPTRSSRRSSTAWRSNGSDGHRRNLVVAATGTGKTVVAALDYRRLREAHGPLTPALRRPSPGDPRPEPGDLPAVLRDAAFGELLVRRSSRPNAGGTSSPRSSRSARAARVRSPEAFDVVIVDEFHHAEAPTYDRLLEHVEPALPPRPHRDPGARRRAERPPLVRRPHRRRAAAVGRARPGAALPRSSTSASRTAPTCATSAGIAGGTTIAELEQPLHRQTTRGSCSILRAARRPGPRPTAMRALGFCVSIGHAEFMAASSPRGGHPRGRPHGDTSDERTRARPCGASATARSTSSSPSTSSTRGSTSPKSTRCSSSGPPRAPRSSSSSSAAGCAWPKARSASPCSTSSATCTGSSASTVASGRSSAAPAGRSSGRSSRASRGSRRAAPSSSSARPSGRCSTTSARPSAPAGLAWSKTSADCRAR